MFYLQYIRIGRDTYMGDVVNILKYNWKLDRPNALIYVIGDTSKTDKNESEELMADKLVEMAHDSGNCRVE